MTGTPNGAVVCGVRVRCDGGATYLTAPMDPDEAASVATRFATSLLRARTDAAGSLVAFPAAQGEVLIDAAKVVAIEPLAGAPRRRPNGAETRPVVTDGMERR